MRLLHSLRKSARLVSTHYSTRIEGNRLTREQVREVVLHGETVPNRERDEAEARNYYRALDYLGTLISEPGEAPDVASLMGDLFTWLAEQRRSRELPVPITAGLAPYQFATIHPANRRKASLPASYGSSAKITGPQFMAL